jgi:hypothetical protein
VSEFSYFTTGFNLLKSFYIKQIRFVFKELSPHRVSKILEHKPGGNSRKQLKEKLAYQITQANTYFSRYSLHFRSNQSFRFLTVGTPRTPSIHTERVKRLHKIDFYGCQTIRSHPELLKVYDSA